MKWFRELLSGPKEPPPPPKTPSATADLKLKPLGQYWSDPSPETTPLSISKVALADSRTLFVATIDANPLKSQKGSAYYTTFTPYVCTYVITNGFFYVSQTTVDATYQESERLWVNHEQVVTVTDLPDTKLVVRCRPLTEVNT